MTGSAARRREVEASRRRLVAAVNAAQAAVVALTDRAAEHDTLLRRRAGASASDELAVDGGALTAWLIYRVAVSRSGLGDRLAGHLRYFAGRRFLEERRDGLLRGVLLPGEGRTARDDRPP